MDKIASEPLVEHHEEAAAFRAAGYAKATGRVGVCLATSGPGAGGAIFLAWVRLRPLRVEDLKGADSDRAEEE